MTTSTPASPSALPQVASEARIEVLRHRIRHLENSIHHQLVKHGVTALRISLGLVFFGFGILKYFPGVSPAQMVVEQTTHILFLHLIPGDVAIKLIATLECFIGLCLLSNRWMRLCVWLLAFEAIGILSPIVLLPGELFSGPHHAPTLLGQYCLKDIILVAAGFVVAAASFRGGHMVRSDLPPNLHAAATPENSDAAHRLRIVLDGLHEPDDTAALCDRHQITEAEFYNWRETVLVAAEAALADPDMAPLVDPAEPPAADVRAMGPAMTVFTLAALRRL